MKGPATGEEDLFATVGGGDSPSILLGSELRTVCPGIAEVSQSLSRSDYQGVAAMDCSVKEGPAEDCRGVGKGTDLTDKESGSSANKPASG